MTRGRQQTWSDAIDADAQREQLVREGRRSVPNRRFGVHVREAETGGRGVLRPAVHAARHDDLRREGLAPKSAVTALLPFLEERQECEGEPVGSNRVRVNDAVERLFLQIIEVGALEGIRGRLCRAIESTLGDPET